MSCGFCVKLLYVSDMLCSCSGGVKRRLSVAISLIGQPLVCFLDEPSTGLIFKNVFVCVCVCTCARSRVYTRIHTRSGPILKTAAVEVHIAGKDWTRHPSHHALDGGGRRLV